MSAYLPASQSVQLAALLELYLPIAQDVHDEDPFDPEYLPASQSVQDDAAAAEYLPV